MNARVERWAIGICCLLLAVASLYGLRHGDVDDAEALRLEWFAATVQWQPKPVIARMVLAVIGLIGCMGGLILLRHLGLAINLPIAAFTMLIMPTVLLWNGRDASILHWLASVSVAILAGHLATLLVHASRMQSSTKPATQCQETLNSAVDRLGLALVAIAVILAVGASIWRIATVHFYMERVQAFLIAALAAGAIGWRLRPQSSKLAFVVPITVLAISAKLLFVHALLPEKDHWHSPRPYARASRSHSTGWRHQQTSAPAFNFYQGDRRSQ